ncbi:hypothetical protein M0813_23788 [Anaeramoeba flamelloides]|uniref:Uncharacterized protein n=1 Tax=Anaeramoeba flamelloides TaxID=1746091 RepID=A0ABQ8Y7S3_9EUKA|nr:hypothetical protein M0813_23788 [Anaeramoeba flamelloides]
MFCEADNEIYEQLNEDPNQYLETEIVSEKKLDKDKEQDIEEEELIIKNMVNLPFTVNHPIYSYFEKADHEFELQKSFSYLWWTISFICLVIQQTYLVLFTKKLDVFSYYVPLFVSLFLLIYFLALLFIVKEKSIRPNAVNAEGNKCKVSERGITGYEYFALLHMIQFCVMILSYQRRLTRLSLDDRIGLGSLKNVICLSAIFYTSYSKIILPADLYDPILATFRNINENIAINLIDCSSLYFLFLNDAGMNKFISVWLLNITIALWFLSTFVRIWVTYANNYPLNHYVWTKIFKLPNEIVQVIDDINETKQLIKKKKGDSKKYKELDYNFESLPNVSTNSVNNRYTNTYFDRRLEETKNNNVLTDLRNLDRFSFLKLNYTSIYRASLGLRMEKICDKFTLLPELFSLVIRIYLLIVNKNIEQAFFFMKNIVCLYRALVSITMSYRQTNKWNKGKYLKWGTLKQSKFWFFLSLVAYIVIFVLVDYYLYKVRGKLAWLATGFAMALLIFEVIVFANSIREVKRTRYLENWFTYLLLLHMFFILVSIAGGRIPFLYWGAVNGKLPFSNSESVWCVNNFCILLIFFSTIFFCKTNSFVKLNWFEYHLQLKQNSTYLTKLAYCKYYPENDFTVKRIAIDISSKNQTLVMLVLSTINAAYLFLLSSQKELSKATHRTVITFCFFSILNIWISVIVGAIHFDGTGTFYSIFRNMLIESSLRLFSVTSMFILRTVLMFKYQIFQSLFLVFNLYQILNWLYLMVTLFRTFKSPKKYRSLFPEINEYN